MKVFYYLILVLVFFTTPYYLYASQPLETETARLVQARVFELENTLEFQTSSEGTETAVPLALLYGINDYLELMIEPVLFTDISPKVGRKATGFGDTEATLTYLFMQEKPKFPALAVAAEVKFPTANDILIGTKQTDFTAYLIASKLIGKFDTHLNLGYTILGKPAGVNVQNVFDYALAEEYHVNPKFDLLAEIVGNTSALVNGTEKNSKENTVSPEIGGEAITGMLGARFYVKPNISLCFGITYDNNNAILFRPGITWTFK